MCIIAAKPAGVRFPSDDTIRTMWNANPDGAGIMYPDKENGKAVVRIEKGFMSLTAFNAALAELKKRFDLDKLPVVMHFRITTHGGTCPELTHPFPIANSATLLRKLRSTAAVGVAHNGIIRSVTPGKDMSDTSEYIRSQLYPLMRALPSFTHNTHALELVKNAIGSKMAFLEADGTITTVGDFVTQDGMLYSNSSYVPYVHSARSVYGGWSTTAYDYPVGICRQLMDIDEVSGSYVALANGEFVDSSTGLYAIDSRSRVYRYNDLIGSFVELPGATAYTSKGTILFLNKKKAWYEDTCTAEEEEYLLNVMADDVPFYDDADDAKDELPAT